MSALRQNKLTTPKSTYKKLEVLWLNEALSFYQSLCLTDIESLRNRHLRVVAKCYGQSYNDRHFDKTKQ